MAKSTPSRGGRYKKPAKKAAQPRWEVREAYAGPWTADNGGGPTEGGDMTERLAKLEQRLDSVLPTLSTKADVEGVRTDVHKGQSEIKTWMIATIFALLLGLFTIGTFISNNVRAIVMDTRPTSPSQATAPVIIQMPAPEAAAVDRQPAKFESRSSKQGATPKKQ